MSWVGLADSRGAEFDLGGLLGRGARGPLQLAERREAQAGRGTVMIEADVAQYTVPRPLIGHGLGASFELTVAFGTDDMLDFTLSIGASQWAHRLPLKIADDSQVVRFSYAWDVASQAGVLSAYQPRSRHLAQCLLTAPRAVPWAALRSLVHEAPDFCRDNDVRFLAVSRAFEPAGAMPGLCGATEIATPTGLRPIRLLQSGDIVMTPEGAPRRVLGLSRRMLPARGSFAPHRLRAPYFGLDKDITLSGESLIHLDGPDVEYLLGVEGVFAQVDQLGEARSTLATEDRTTVCYYQLILDSVDVLDAGVGVASLDLGAAGRDGLSGATTLWTDVQGQGPIGHLPSPFPTARSYEIVTLNARRAA